MKSKYYGMSVFQEAKQRENDGMGYRASRYKIIWSGNREESWQHISIRYGIRWSDNWQIFPIRNVSDNCHRAIMFGFWKLYFELNYARAKNCHYLFKMPYFRQLRRFYLLFF